MLEPLKNFLRKRSLKKFTDTEPTGILPVSRIRSAVAVIDVEDSSCDDCKLALQAFFRENGIKGEIIFFDFRKIENGERLITSVANTVLRKDLDWCGRLSREKTHLLHANETDLFLSLIPGTPFPLEYLTKCVRARFRAGRAQLPGNPFDLVVTDPAGQPLNQKESFEAMRSLFAKIN